MPNGREGYTTSDADTGWKVLMAKKEHVQYQSEKGF